MSIPFLSLMKAKAKLIVGGLLGLVFLFGLLLLLLSDLGFPYTSKEGDRRPQRLTIYHSQLVDGTGGFYVHRSDYHWAAELEDSVPAYKNATWVSRGSCNDSRRMSMVCVMPEANLKDLWIEAAPPAPPQETSLAWEKQVDGDFVKLRVTARGPSLIRMKMTATPEAFFISPPATSKVREELIVSLVSGEENQTNTFEVLLGGRLHSKLIVSMSGHHTSGEGMVEPVLQQFKEEHPSWTTISAYTLENKIYLIPL